MAQPPRPRDESLLRGFVVWRVVYVSLLFLAGIFGAWFWAMYNYDDAVVASTLAVNTLVAMEVFYLFAVRYLDTPSITLRGVLGTPVVLLAVFAVIVLQSLFTWVPWFQDTFASTALSPEALGFAVLAGVAVLVLLELETAIRRRFRAARG
jgi:magnesium-transporting ATPase (P-type)